MVLKAVILVGVLVAIAHLAASPSPGLGQDAALAVVMLAVLRAGATGLPDSRIERIREAQWLGLYLTTALCLFWLAEIDKVAGLGLPLALGVSGTGLFLALALLTRPPAGNRSDPGAVASVAAASVAASVVWYCWSEPPLHLAVVNSLLVAVFLTMPGASLQYLPLAAGSRGGFAIYDLSHRLIFAICLALLIGGLEVEFSRSLVLMTVLMLLVSACRIWRWQPATAPGGSSALT